ncbi:MAG: EpsI family protein [Lentisphaerae bacterium]|nr:EpsI family protein [Lentisphaerota bacterium]
MKLTTGQAAWVICGMLAACLGALIMERVPPPADNNPVPIPLPALAGAYSMTSPLFCQNENCMSEVEDASIAASSSCPECGGALAERTLPESRILPKGTFVSHAYYRRAGNSFSVAAVVAGSEPTSIHRPQQCLPAQGLTIVGRSTLTVGNTPDTGSLALTVLRARRDGRPGRGEMLYAYWFTDGTRETPYHIARLAMQAADRLAGKKPRKWAYVSVSVPVLSRDDPAEARLSEFVRALHGAMTGAIGAPASSQD